MIEKIIHSFLHNTMPAQIQRQFRSWCLNNEHSKQIEDALWQEWEQLNASSVLKRETKSYRHKLSRLHEQMTPAFQPPRRAFGVSRRIAAVAATVVVLLMCVEFFVVKHLATDDTIHLITAENSKGRFTLPDGSVVWLNADSRLAYSERFAESDNRSVRLEGEAFFDVTRDTLRPFEVQMGKLRVKVLGTQFNASSLPALAIEEVTLLSGSVEVSGCESGHSIVLAPDQSCIYDASSGFVTVRNVSAGDHCSWTGNSIVFDNKQLADIAVNLEHWYNIRIHIDKHVDASMRISFTLRPETLEETLKIIETLTHLKCRQVDQHHVTIHKQ